MRKDFEDLIADYPACCDNGKICTEKGKRFTIISNETFTRLHIDSCVINDLSVQKCDYGFIRHTNDEIYFVELKGGDISTAINQLVSTYDYFNRHLVKIPKSSLSCFIVSSKFPKGTEEQKKILKFAKEFGPGCLHIKNTQSEIRV